MKDKKRYIELKNELNMLYDKMYKLSDELEELAACSQVEFYSEHYLKILEAYSPIDTDSDLMTKQKQLYILSEFSKLEVAINYKLSELELEKLLLATRINTIETKKEISNTTLDDLDLILEIAQKEYVLNTEQIYGSLYYLRKVRNFYFEYFGYTHDYDTILLK